MSTITAETWDCTIDEYHGEREHDSHSSIKVARKCLATYFHTYITGRIPPKASTREQRLGSVVDAALLEPDKLDQLAKVIPAEVLTSDGARRGKKWDEWQAANAGPFHVTPEEYDRAAWIVEQVHACKAAHDLIDNATAFQRSIRWQSDAGHKLKARFDGMLEADFVFFDLKTSRRPGRDEFWRQVRELGYHQQLALYSDGFAALHGVRPQAKWIVVDNNPPHLCYVHNCPEALLLQGAEDNARTLAMLYECRQRMRPWLPDGYGEEGELYVPSFVYSESESFTPDEPGIEVRREF